MRRIIVGRGAALALAVAASAVSAPAAAQTYFEDVDGAFPGQGCAGAGCWTNYLRLSDLDGDGDLDAVFPNASGFFSSPGAQPLEIFLNDGAGAFTLGTDVLLGEAVSGAFRVAAIGDVDGDGRRDLFLPSASGAADRLYVQTADGVFEEQAAARIGSQSRSAAARFGDVDGDGDLDLLVAAGYAASDTPPARLYLNDGDGSFSEALGALPASLEGEDPDDVDFVDVDGDFDVDVLVNTHTGKDSLWINDGGGVFTDGSSRLPPLQDPSAFHYGPAACDIDGDGDRDILIDNVGPNYAEQVLINDGTGTFTADSARLGGNTPGTDDNGIVCLDFDDDGDFDVVVMSLSSNGERLFENDGTGHFTRLAGAFSSLVDPTLWMEAGDVNGDGRLDVVTAQGEGSPQVERLYLGTDAVTVDATPPDIFAVEQDASWPVVRFALRDVATSDEGPRIERAEAIVPGAGEPIPATFMGGDLFRVELPAITASYQLCATDLAGNAGCIDLQHGGGSGGGGAGGDATTGAGGDATTTTSSSGGPATTGASGVTTGATTSGGGGSDDGATGAGGDTAILDPDDGCGCGVVGRADTRADLRAMGAGVAIAIAALFRARRRKGGA